MEGKYANNKHLEFNKDCQQKENQEEVQQKIIT
jgi:hypothetical protein